MTGENQEIALELQELQAGRYFHCHFLYIKKSEHHSNDIFKLGAICS